MKVPEPRKLPSGNYNIRLRLNGEEISITKPTKTECTQEAALIKAEHRAGKRTVVKNTDLTLGTAIDKYIAKYESVLSPATVRGYISSRKNRFKGYMEKPIREIKDWQEMINKELSLASEHTVKNAWGVVSPSLSDLGIPVPTVKLAKVPVNELSFLDPDEIPPFLEALKGDSAEIELLLELHSLRESEAMYVVKNNLIDLKHNVIHVKGALVPNKEHKLVEKKTNKTNKSTRDIPIMIPRLAELVKYHQDNNIPIKTHAAPTLLSHVHKTCKKAGVTDTTNHGLRRTAASLGYSVGLSERAIMDLGGWDDPQTMHKIYIKLSQRDKDKANKAMSEFYLQDHDDYSKALKELSTIRDRYKDVQELKDIYDLIDEKLTIKNADKNADGAEKTQ